MKINKFFKISDLSRDLITAGISIADLENWQQEDFSAKDYPLIYGVYQTLKPLSDEQINKSLKEIKQLYIT